MPKNRVHAFTISLDGFGAGPHQDYEHPMGAGAENLHAWLRGTRTFQLEVLGQDSEGETGPDDDFAARGFEGIGAWIMGRNMFGPLRGPWRDDDWRGWWGETPPYHCDVFVLTNHGRAAIEMDGGTVFHFVTDGIHTALERAKASAGQQDVRIGGGVSTIRQFLQAGLVDELHVAVSPILLGTGEHLLGGVDLVESGFNHVEYVPTSAAAHYVLSKSENRR
jgi:dihydrofolate reductase